MSDRSRIVQAKAGFRWTGTAVAAYKTETASHSDITRQTLLGDGPEKARSRSVLRYFEIEPGGHSSLERHLHEHIVVVLRGQGHVILGDRLEPIGLHDCVYVAPGTIHQFHATAAEPLGFLCLVDRLRDRPARPNPIEIDEMSRNPAIAKLLKT